MGGTVGLGRGQKAWEFRLSPKWQRQCTELSERGCNSVRLAIPRWPCHGGNGGEAFGHECGGGAQEIGQRSRWGFFIFLF